MSFSGFVVNSLEVRDRNGTPLGTLTGKVKLQAGSGCGIESEGNVITLSVGRQYTDPDNCYLQKFRALVEGGTVDDCNGGTTNFSGMPYYIATINGEGPGEASNYDFYGSASGQVGIWNGSSILNGGALEITDIGAACIDCEDYEQIKELMERIREFQYADVNRNLYDGLEPGDPGPGELALFRQYQATIHYWNYLVHEQSIPLELIRGSERYFGIQSGYFLKDCSERTVTQTLEVTIAWQALAAAAYVDFEFTNVKTHLGNELPPPPITVTKISAGKYTIVIEYPTMSYREFYTWQIVGRPIDENKLIKYYSINVKSTWVGTHIPGDPVRERDLLS